MEQKDTKNIFLSFKSKLLTWTSLCSMEIKDRLIYSKKSNRFLKTGFDQEKQVIIEAKFHSCQVSNIISSTSVIYRLLSVAFFKNKCLLVSGISYSHSCCLIFQLLAVFLSK